MNSDQSNNQDIILANEDDFVFTPPATEKQPEPSPPPRQIAGRPPGCGCVSGAVTIMLGILVAIIVAFVLIFFFASDTRDKIVGNVESGFNICLVDCGDDVLVIEEGPVLQALENTNWHEGAVAIRNYPSMKASKDWPVSWLTGSRSLKYNAIVKVTAGVDFELIADMENAIEVDGDVITITIPPPQIRDCFLLEDESSYYDYSCSAVGIVPACGDLEDELRLHALKSSANDDYETLLNDAFDNVEIFIEELVLGTNAQVRRVYVVMDTELEVNTQSEAGTCANYSTNTESIWDTLRDNAQE